jgi:hypothetical protein
MATRERHQGAKPRDFETGVDGVALLNGEQCLLESFWVESPKKLSDAGKWFVRLVFLTERQTTFEDGYIVAPLLAVINGGNLLAGMVSWDTEYVDARKPEVVRCYGFGALPIVANRAAPTFNWLSWLTKSWDRKLKTGKCKPADIVGAAAWRRAMAGSAESAELAEIKNQFAKLERSCRELTIKTSLRRAGEKGRR